jgi:ATP synthase protein I
MPGRRGREDGEGLTSAFSKAQPYLDAVWLMTGSVALGTLSGFFLDRRFGTKPWLLVAGALLGVSGGFYSFIRAVIALDKKPR